MIDWKPEAISAAWRAFNDASENPMREAINAAIEKNGLEHIDETECFEMGYSQAVNDIFGLINNWRSDNKELLDEVANAVMRMKSA